MWIHRGIFMLLGVVGIGYVAEASALPPTSLALSNTLLSRANPTCTACSTCSSTCTLCQPQCLTPTPKSCDFYSTCLEASIPCGPTGYALSYGGKNCKKFVANTALFSPAGVNWFYGVMTCLQTALIPVASGCNQTCAAVQTAAFASHARCYIDNGFCDKLELRDYVAVLLTAGTDLLGLEPIKEVLDTVGGCAEKFAKAVEGFRAVGLKGWVEGLNVTGEAV